MLTDGKFEKMFYIKGFRLSKNKTKYFKCKSKVEIEMEGGIGVLVDG